MGKLKSKQVNIKIVGEGNSFDYSSSRFNRSILDASVRCYSVVFGITGDPWCHLPLRQARRLQRFLDKAIREIIARRRRDKLDRW